MKTAARDSQRPTGSKRERERGREGGRERETGDRRGTRGDGGSLQHLTCSRDRQTKKEIKSCQKGGGSPTRLPCCWWPPRKAPACWEVRAPPPPSPARLQRRFKKVNTTSTVHTTDPHRTGHACTIARVHKQGGPDNAHHAQQTTRAMCCWVGRRALPALACGYDGPRFLDLPANRGKQVLVLESAVHDMTTPTVSNASPVCASAPVAAHHVSVPFPPTPRMHTRMHPTSTAGTVYGSPHSVVGRRPVLKTCRRSRWRRYTGRAAWGSQRRCRCSTLQCKVCGGSKQCSIGGGDMCATKGTHTRWFGARVRAHARTCTETGLREPSLCAIPHLAEARGLITRCRRLKGTQANAHTHCTSPTKQVCGGGWLSRVVCIVKTSSRTVGWRRGRHAHPARRPR